MALNSDGTNQLFQPLFEDFKLNHDYIKEHYEKNKSQKEDIFPKELRLFRVRLRLAIGLVIDFDEDYAMVKREGLRDTYIEIMKCNEAWFSYESMKVMCDEWNLTKANSPKYDIFDAENLAKFNISDITELCNAQIKNQIYSSSTITDDVKCYLLYLTQSNTIRNGLRNTINPIINKIENNQEWLPKEIFSVIYATRNIFVHNSDTAQSGIKYVKNKILLLKILYDYIILFQLKVINFAFDTKIKEYGLKK